MTQLELIIQSLPERITKPIDVNEGDLVLIRPCPQQNRTTKEQRPFTLGVVSYIDVSGWSSIQLSQEPSPIMIYPSFAIGDKIFGRTHPAYTSRFKVNRIKELLVGQKEILERLSELVDFRIHSEWIKYIKHPYRFPKSQKISFYYIDFPYNP
ncbi:hypothetical protein HYV49_02095 [Candidatus Pacearchaeota archaeon]|nr:hypothetical protein [Candidatus Pacearchaeota archaeon]